MIRPPVRKGLLTKGRVDCEGPDEGMALLLTMGANEPSMEMRPSSKVVTEVVVREPCDRYYARQAWWPRFWQSALSLSLCDGAFH